MTCEPFNPFGVLGLARSFRAMAPAAWKTGKLRQTTRTLSRQLVVHALKLLRKCLADAIDDDRFTGDNPTRDARVSRKPTTEDAWTYLTADEVKHLLTSDAVP